MFEKDRIEATIHYALSFVGGYFGIYALMARCNNFGSSQTSNLIYIMSGILGNNPVEVALRIGAALLYMGAIFLTIWLPKHFKVNLKILSIIIDFTAAAILGFMPLELNHVLGLYPIFFAMAFQWNSFTGARGYVSATIFSTNNLRQVTAALTEYATGNKTQLDKLKFYSATIGSFEIGVAVSFVLWNYFSVRSIWFCFIPLLVSLALVLREAHLNSGLYLANIKASTFNNKKAA